MARGKKYDETFKKQVASRVIRGEDLKEVAENTGVSHYTLGDWVREYRPKKRTPKRKTVRRTPVSNGQGNSYEALEIENAILKRKVEFWEREWTELFKRKGG